MEEEPEMEEEEEDVPEEDVGEDGGMMESEILEDASGGMTAEGRKRQKRQTMPYMTKYERARILGSVIPPPSHPALRCCRAYCSSVCSCCSCCCEAQVRGFVVQRQQACAPGWSIF